MRTVNPDGSEQRVVFGVPGKISQPDVGNLDDFEPTPWEAYTYDENDTAGRTHGEGDAAHFDTPTSVISDALGRPGGETRASSRA